MNVEKTNKYEPQTLAQLKILLRERNLKVSGKKKELIERLVFDDVSRIPAEPEPEFHMTTPEQNQYKDLHAGQKDGFPPLSKKRVLEYFDSCGKKFESKCEELYSERYVKYIRTATKDELHFVKACVWAEMKKSVSYIVDISVDKDGVVNETQCECAVGQGPMAHCKHIGCVLHGLCTFKEKGVVMTEMTCTQKLQTFHQVKPHRGSPIKTKDLHLIRGKDESMLYDPRPLKYQNVDGKMDRLRNLFANKHDGLRRPVMQLFPPADILSVGIDHDYQELSMEEDFLRKMNVTHITEEDIETIERNTRGQRENKLWLDERKKRTTSSIFGTVCKITDRRNVDELIDSVIRPQVVNSAAIVHGKKYEKVALELFQNVTGVDVQECGLYIAKDKPMLAASPDGRLDDDTILEIKCPFASRNATISSATVPYLYEKDGKLHLKESHNYYYQVQGQMYCANAKYCKFVVYTFHSLEIIDVAYDEDFVQLMLIKLEKFYNTYFKEALLNNYLYRNTNKINFN